MKAMPALFATVTFVFACAAVASPEYFIRGTVAKSGSAYACEIEVRNPVGTQVHTRQLEVERGVELVYGLPRDCCNGMRARVGVLVNRTEHPVAVLEVRASDGTATFYDTILEWKSSIAVAPTIDLRVENAALADVIPKFRNVSGMRITGSPADLALVTVTADMRGVPWPDALREILEPNLFWRYQGKRSVRIDRVDAVPLSTSEEYSKPVPIDVVEAAFPLSSRASVSGVLILEAVIDENGSVPYVKVLKPLPFGLAEAAAAAFRQWRWQPATKGEKAVAVRLNQAVSLGPSVVESRNRGAARSTP